MGDTKVGFSIPATITFEDEELSEDEAVERLVEWWEQASEEEKLAVFSGDGETLAENLIFIDHKREGLGNDEVIAEY